MNNRLRTRDNLSADQLTLLVEAIREELQMVVKNISRKHRSNAEEYLAALNVNIDGENILKSYHKILQSLFKFIDSTSKDAAAQRIVQPLKSLLIHNLKSQHEAGWESPDEDYNEEARIVQALGKLEEHSYYHSTEEKFMHNKWIPEVTVKPSEEDIKVWKSILRAVPEAVDGYIALFSTKIIDHLQNELLPFNVKHINDMFFQTSNDNAVEEFTANYINTGHSEARKYTIKKRIDVKKLQSDSAIVAGFDALSQRLDDLKKYESRLCMLSARNIRILYFEILVNYLHEQSYAYHDGSQVDELNWTDMVKAKARGMAVHIHHIERAIRELNKFVESEYQNITSYLTDYSDSIKKLGDAGFADRIAQIEERIPYRFRTVSIYHTKRKNDTETESTEEQFTNAVMQSGIATYSNPAEIRLFLQKIKAVKYNRYVDIEMPDWKGITSETKDVPDNDCADLPSKSILFTVSSMPLSGLGDSGEGKINQQDFTESSKGSNDNSLMGVTNAQREAESADACCHAACNFNFNFQTTNKLQIHAEINRFMQLLIKAIYVSLGMQIPDVKMEKLLSMLYDRECISDAAFVLMNNVLDTINQSGDTQITDESMFTRTLEIVELLKTSINLFHARKQSHKIFEINWKMAPPALKDEASLQLTGRLAALQQVQSNLLMMIDYHMHSVNSIFYGEKYRGHLVNTLISLDAIKVKLLKSYISCRPDVFNEEIQSFLTGVKQSALSCNQLKKIILPLQTGSDQYQRKFSMR